MVEVDREKEEGEEVTFINLGREPKELGNPEPIQMTRTSWLLHLLKIQQEPKGERNTMKEQPILDTSLIVVLGFLVTRDSQKRGLRVSIEENTGYMEVNHVWGLSVNSLVVTGELGS